MNTTSPVEKLRAALKPFAEQATHHSDKMPDEMFIDDYEQIKGSWVSFAQLRIGDLRRAAEAYATLSQPGMAGWKIEALRNALSIRLNDYLVELKPGYDDSITGFNEAWDVVRKFFDDKVAVFTAQSVDGFEPSDFADLHETFVEASNDKVTSALLSNNYNVILAALKRSASPMPVERNEVLEMEAKGQALLDALLVRFPDLKEHPDLIHSTDIGKGLLRAIREFHLAWADFGTARILKMSDAEVLSTPPAAVKDDRPLAGVSSDDII